MAIELEALRQVPLFAALPDDELARVAALTKERHYQRGDLILLEGDQGGALHYVRSGVVKIYTTSAGGKEQVLRLATAGQTFNDVPALDGGPNPASAAAMEASVIYAIERAQLRRLILERPAIADGAVRSLAGMLRHLVALVEDLSFRTVTARAAKIILELDAQPAAHRRTQQEIAAMVGTAREVLGRALKTLEASGAIALRRGQIVVLDRERLRLLSE